MNHNLTIGVLLALVLGASGAWAAGSTSSSTRSSESSDFDRAVKAVKAKNYAKALPLLESVVARDASNADAWNYLGFSHRKLGDYDKALAAYQKALAIDPEHRGALEYLGELYLDKGDLAMAEQQLKKLDGACTFGCDEYDDLKAAIAKHKS